MDFNRREFLNSTVASLGGLAVASHAAQTLAPRLAIHGGAGTIERSRMTPEREKAYRQGLTEALRAGYDVLLKKGSSLDAVVTAIKVLEDSPLFNAGKGAVFTNAGTNELDASIMDGQTLKAGAVASLKHIKNPITLARLVMDRSRHVMLAGEGAEKFAREQGGIEFVEQKYFYTEDRWKSLQRIREAERQKEPGKPSGGAHFAAPRADQDRYGTVGAVARDVAGNLAAGTSTGGLTNKRFGRIGDAPIIGAGTYANNKTCAVSATGDGEFFIRTVVAHDISALIEYKNMPLKQAARAVLDKVQQLGGSGGVIVLGRDGEITMPFNTTGMYRGHINADGQPITQIFSEQ